jgi:hypothetical protein
MPPRVQKLDALVALAGAVVLAIAVTGAALSGGTLARSQFEVSYPTHAHGLAEPAKSPIPPRATYAFLLTEPNVVNVTAAVTFSSPAPFPPGVSAHVKLASPDGRSVEGDNAPTTGSSAFTVRVEMTGLGSPPANGTLPGATPGDAARAAYAQNSTAAFGNWTVEASYAAAAPVAPPGESETLVYGWGAWTAQVEPVPPTSK